MTLKKALKISLIIISISIITCFIIGEITLYIILKDNLGNDPIEDKGYVRDTFIVNQDGLRLHGKYITAANKTNKVIILVHGCFINLYGMTALAHFYNQESAFLKNPIQYKIIVNKFLHKYI